MNFGKWALHNMPLRISRINHNLTHLCNSWICRKDWKLHGSATGGFFRCNIWKEEEEGNSKGIPPATESSEDAVGDDQGFGTAIHSAREHYRKKQEINRFLHHYTRYEAHGESAALERRMADTASTRLAPVVDAAIEFDGSPAFNFGGKGTSLRLTMESMSSLQSIC